MPQEYGVNMKLATLTCPACHTYYESSVVGNDFVVRCPNCGQNNNVPLQAQYITGVCPDCGRPLDDHEFRGSWVKPCKGSDYKAA